MELNKIYNEDCLITLSNMEDESVDLVVTSPPYNKNHWIKNKVRRSDDFIRKIEYSTYDDNLPHDEYVDWQKKVISECQRVLKPNGLYLMTDPFEIMDDLIFEKNIKDVGLYMLEKRNITFFVLGAVLDEINYFNKRHNLDEDVKKFYIDLYKDKKIVYENLHNYYISYVIKKVG